MTPSLNTAWQGAPSKIDLLVVLTGLLVLFFPTYQVLDRMVWVREGMGHGPIMLALIAWLIWTRLPDFFKLPQATASIATGVSLLIAVALYLLGRTQDLMIVDTFSQVFFLSSVALYYRGWRGLRHMWFPLFFYLFVLPMPPSLVDIMTSPLKMAVSQVSADLLYSLGFPVGREGVSLVIGPYTLLVADACAGINSIFSLEAVGVFYMSVAGHTNKWRNLALAVLILPISFFSNTVRVCTLVLVTYYFGDAVGQGFVHEFAGIFLFMIATLATLGVDSILGLFFKNAPRASTGGQA